MGAASRADRRRWGKWVAMLAAMAGAALIALYGWAPRPPSPKLEGVDVAIADAIRSATARVRLLPWLGTTWGRLGSVFYVHHFNAEAEEAFAHAERLSARDPRWPYLRGLSMAEEDLDAALPMLRRAAERSGDGPAAPRLRYAELLLERGDLEEAEAQIARVLRRDAHDGRALLNMGRLAFARGDFAASRKHLERSLERAPAVKATRTLLANVLLRLGDEAGAEAELARAAPLDEKAFWPDAFRQEAQAYRAGKDALIERSAQAIGEGDFGAALRLLEKATREYPDAIRAWNSLAHVHRQRQDIAAARHAIERALALDPASVEAHVELGGIFYDEKKFAEAEKHFREAVRVKPDSAEAWFNLGLSLTSQRQLPGAVEALQKARALKPHLPEACIFLGQALAMSGQLAAAATELEQALKLSPSDQRAQTLLAQVRQALGGTAPK